jgi:hypothetical protein
MRIQCGIFWEGKNRDNWKKQNLGRARATSPVLISSVKWEMRGHGLKNKVVFIKLFPNILNEVGCGARP